MYICVWCVCGLCVCVVCVCVCEIVRLISQIATQNCLYSYSKLNLGNKFHAEVAKYLPHIKLKTLYTLNILF